MEEKSKYSTREKILYEGLKLIQTKGYNGFSYKDIAEKVGIRKASVHHYFPSKADLGLEAIQYYGNKLMENADKLLNKDIDTMIKLNAYFDFFINWFAKDERACPIGVLTAEYATIPKKIQQEVRIITDYDLSWIERVIIEGCRNGTFAWKGSPREKAIEIATTIQGAVLIARIYGITYIENICTQIRKDLTS